MALFITLNDGSEIRWYTWDPPIQTKPEQFPIEIEASGPEMESIFDALGLGEIERRAYYNMSAMTWNDPVSIRGIMAAMKKHKSKAQSENLSLEDEENGVGSERTWKKHFDNVLPPL